MVEFYINVIHFCLYKAHIRLHTFFNKINPSNLIHKIPAQKKKYKELGIDISKEIDKAFYDKSFGLSVIFSGGVLLALMFFFIISIINIGTKFIFHGTITKFYLIISAILSLFFYYIFIYKQNKYLMYYEQFDQLSISKKRWFCLITFTVILLVFLIMVLAFR